MDGGAGDACPCDVGREAGQAARAMKTVLIFGVPTSALNQEGGDTILNPGDLSKGSPGVGITPRVGFKPSGHAFLMDVKSSGLAGLSGHSCPLS